MIVTLVVLVLVVQEVAIAVARESAVPVAMVADREGAVPPGNMEDDRAPRVAVGLSVPPMEASEVRPRRRLVQPDQ
jgi:hypothetical protein